MFTFDLDKNFTEEKDLTHFVSKTFEVLEKNIWFFKGAQVGGRTWDLFDFRLFSLTSSALDHSATAPP